ncbi:hypothetical protein HPC49_22145 [Pyxidicoccus fallax]|uniref:Uncharacterized protein n=1 Tax=Pyxidicoccus fallax TaxID=394095 RepID=A0A848LIY2_9BACT|nr:hypothetical protein [Pyxidicoccus fallax]NMO17695.1 hypothetical protein [Pyxidicoccus fallax]NPC80914.1 hypothetical protein [Pyxidicoccus fallax]
MLRDRGAPPTQDAVTQFGKTVAEQYFGIAITVQSLPEGAVRLIGEPYVLQHEPSSLPPGAEQVAVFSVLTLNASLQVTRLELRTPSLTGQCCEQSLPSW